MPDSSTTNPSDPGQPGHGPGSDPVWQADSPPPGADGPGASADQPQKLKLKKLLTPLSPHLKAPREHHDANPDAEKEHFESPHAVPVELEPEPPPPDPEPHMTAPTGPGFDQPLPDPADPAAAAPENPEPGDEAEPAAEGAVPAPNGKARKTAAPARRRRLTVLSLPVVLLLAIVYVLNLLFDPFGQQAPGVSPPAAGVAGTGRPAQPERNPQATLSGAELRTRLQQVTVADYLGQLEKAPVHVSQHPPGAFIGGAFIPVGQPVNPALGLTLAQVLDEAIVLTDAAGAEHRLTVE